MEGEPPRATRIWSVVVDTDDPQRLAEFYAQVLGWSVTDAGDTWANVTGPDGGAELSFQMAINHRPPTWPASEIPQQLHIDFAVPDLADAVARARGLGARHSGVPDSPTFVTLIDPSGHPFCLCLAPECRALQ